ncbi:hypothetical protein OZX67_09080 [Bifidobacterium sp. ESL0728]|uniref:hypothetical protein n=1 Tax=Bifidobacterium sp. ESL0728 TaxID=2983220 RepID=UPI0023F95782|nr:hypothetical protein [Bifidobacterium sp. ESL0728]WEV58922.1 hypothetical protein OZX67_09080 [Bifidobacterium sp. ESL0728]
MNTTTTSTQRISQSTIRETTKRDEYPGTGRPPPPNTAKPDIRQRQGSGRPGVLGRKQRNRKLKTRKDEGREKEGCKEARFDENVPDLPERSVPTSTATSVGNGVNNGNGTGVNNGTSVGNVSTTMMPAPVNRTMPMLMSNRDLPGPLSMNRLDDFGAVHRLDDINAYLAEYSDTLFGRGIIMTKVVPRPSIACGRSALWVWMGGTFPDAIDIISASHFRSMAYGRPIKTYDRNVPEGQMSSIAGLKVTSPTRTACDIALMSSSTIPDKRRAELTCAIVQEYHIDPVECLEILEKNHFWPNVPQARQFFKAVQYCF